LHQADTVVPVHTVIALRQMNIPSRTSHPDLRQFQRIMPRSISGAETPTALSGRGQHLSGDTANLTRRTIGAFCIAWDLFQSWDLPFLSSANFKIYNRYRPPPTLAPWSSSLSSTRVDPVSSPLLQERHSGVAEGHKRTFYREPGIGDEWTRCIR